jgi:uncharacterized protein
MTPYSFQNKTVLVTGASMGIGEVFARTLAARGARLVLVARGRERLEALARELVRPDTDPVVIALDLTDPGAPRRLFEELRARRIEIDVLINNAGFAAFGPFTDVPADDQLGQVDLNVRALVALSHLFLPMVERRRGGILHVASTAAFQPVPFLAVYGATKAFVLSFSEALWAEYRDRDVRIVALCPGATDTPFFARAGEAAAFGSKAHPEDVVKLGLEAFDRNRPTVIHGLANGLTAGLPRIFPRSFVARISALLMRPEAPKPRLTTG